MGWTQIDADDIGAYLPIEQLDLIYNNLVHLRDQLSAQTGRDASIVDPGISSGRNTSLDKVQEIINYMEIDLMLIHTTAGWVNPYYGEQLRWTKLTKGRRAKVVRWVRWANFLYDEICANHDGFDYLCDVNNDIICDINNVPIVCFV